LDTLFCGWIMFLLFYYFLYSIVNYQRKQLWGNFHQQLQHIFFLLFMSKSTNKIFFFGIFVAIYQCFRVKNQNKLKLKKHPSSNLPSWVMVRPANTLLELLSSNGTHWHKNQFVYGQNRRLPIFSLYTIRFSDVLYFLLN